MYTSAVEKNLMSKLKLNQNEVFFSLSMFEQLSYTFHICKGTNPERLDPYVKNVRIRLWLIKIKKLIF